MPALFMFSNNVFHSSDFQLIFGLVQSQFFIFRRPEKEMELEKREGMRDQLSIPEEKVLIKLLLSIANGNIYW
jgi:hypothetical protein